MFNFNLPEINESNLVKSNMGVDLRHIECHRLQEMELYSKYSKDQLHYVIDAVQKGRKPPTQIGLKRLIKKNAAKQIKMKKLLKMQIPELNPKAPEEICMKALRTEFRYKIQKVYKQALHERKTKSETIIKHKQHQRKRRIELIKLAKKYREQLGDHFADRLRGYGRCPKVSRKQIKDYLKTLGIEANLDPEIEEQPIHSEKNKVPAFKEEDFPSLLSLKI